MTSNAPHKHLFYSEMAKLLEAGFDIRKAAAVLMDTKLPAAQAALLKDLNQGLEAGGSITSSLAKDTTQVTELERNIIGAGERGGKLAPAFQHLADYFGMIAAARNEAIKGIIYPLVVLHFGIVLSIVPTALMKGENLGTVFGTLLVTLLAVYITVFVAFLAIRVVFRMAPENAGVDRLLNRIPWIGKARRNMAMARFCKVYHSCILAGISMNETVQLASNASASGVIRESGAVLAKAAKAGESLGPRFMADAAFPQAFARSYSTGEEAGTLDKDLANWSKLFQDEAQATAKTAAVMVPKVFYFFILAFVAWRIISFFSGYYEGLDKIGE